MAAHQIFCGEHRVDIKTCGCPQVKDTAGAESLGERTIKIAAKTALAATYEVAIRYTARFPFPPRVAEGEHLWRVRLTAERLPDPAQWRRNREKENEAVEHPCDDSDPDVCMCKGTCGCHK